MVQEMHTSHKGYGCAGYLGVLLFGSGMTLLGRETRHSAKQNRHWEEVDLLN